MMEFCYEWEWGVGSGPEKLWRWVADTERFNRDTGLPKVLLLEYGKNGKKKVSLRKFGIAVEWEEEPFDWIWPLKFGVVRNYTKGPIRQVKTETELKDGKVIYRVWAVPANVLGWIVIPIQIGWWSKKKFGQVIKRYDQLAKSEKKDVVVGKNLEEFIEKADDFEVSFIRPYKLADAWGKKRRDVLRTCLQGVRDGLLELEWDVICPMCRGVRQSSGKLAEINEQVHCEACGIDFEVNFERYVEITFHPHPRIRAVPRVEYCVGGPGLTPHVLAQQVVGPGERVETKFGSELPEGRYRWRGLGEVKIQKAKGKTKTKNLEIKLGDKWTNEKVVKGDENWIIENDTDEEKVVIFEKLAWSDQLTTAAEVIATAEFRDLFAAEALRPGQKISVGSMAIVFTDLKGSTQMYRALGDAPAFGYVLDHFEVLKKAVADNEGAIVKTIGDAIMAVFVRPVNAVKGMMEAQEGMNKFNDPALKLKVGVHFGPCIAVNLNDRLDYFGSTVNLASRLEGQADGEGVVITQAVAADPEVKNWLKKSAKVEDFKSVLKGFEEEEFRLIRIMRRGGDLNPR